MGYRRRGRELALKVLYRADLTHEETDCSLSSVLELLGSGEPGQEANPELESKAPSQELKRFASELVQGVREHLGEIDQLLMRTAQNWRVERMTTVDRNILRLAIYELLYCPEIPVRVSINEAIELAKRFGSAESPAFINGILDTILDLDVLGQRINPA
ncbi:MAG: transcription antitermination factor NusB [bacterium]